ncbi:MAG: FecR domain-containing protein [Prevotella sp.]|nr:FecR domain-containing protein [Prevotella sp.]
MDIDNLNENELDKEIADIGESPEMEQIITEALINKKDRRHEAQREWDRLAARIGIGKPKNTSIYMLRYAACVAAIVATAVVVWLYRGWSAEPLVVYSAKPETGKVVMTSGNVRTIVKKDSIEIKPGDKPAEWQTITVPADKDFHLHLPDGSKVWLNANAVFSYPTRFGKTREVRLEGEAYFSVTSDPQHPFIVATGDIMTRVVGTEFNVDYTEGDAPCITLVSGRVDIDDASGKTLAELQPNESATVEGKTVSKREVDVDDKICWRDGIQLFDNDTLEDILISMGSWYNMSVVCRDMPELKCRYHFIYDRHSDVHNAMKMLSEISKIKINIEKNTIFVD